MANDWRDLYNRIPAERRDRIEEQVTQDLAEMRLADTRRARELTQKQIADNLNVNQAWVSKVERQADMYVSTLRSYVEAMGGELEIIAKFPDAQIRLTQFEALSGKQECESEGGSFTTTITGSLKSSIVWTAQSTQRPGIAGSSTELGNIVWGVGADSRTPGHNTPSRTPKMV